MRYVGAIPKTAILTETGGSQVLASQLKQAASMKCETTGKAIGQLMKTALNSCNVTFISLFPFIN